MDKILIISNVSGGLYSFRYELIQKLAEKYHVTIMTSNTGHVEDFTALGCAFIESPIECQGTNPIKELELISFYKKMIKAVSPKVVLTYTIKPNIYAGIVCSLLNIPYIANITGLGAAVEYPGKMQKFYIALYRYGLRKAQKVFFQNAANRDFMLERKMVRGAYDLIPGSGVNLEKYEVLEYPSDECVHFSFIARIRKEKGIDQYLDAAKYIKAKYPNTVFHVCGNCTQAYQEVVKELHDQGIIIYHGRVNDIAGMHRISHCTIHPTYYPEGMSNVLLESASCARPIITTDRPGCREVIDDGVNGFIVKQKDSADLIEKVEKFLALSWEQKKQMGLAGRTKVEKEFSRNIVIQKYLDEVNGVGKV